MAQRTVAGRVDWSGRARRRAFSGRPVGFSAMAGLLAACAGAPQAEVGRARTARGTPAAVNGTPLAKQPEASNSGESHAPAPACRSTFQRTPAQPPAPCESDEVVNWLGGSAPSSGWWLDFVASEARHRWPKNHPGMQGYRVRLQIFGLDSTSDVVRAHRQYVGQYHVCYEMALSKDPTVHGHWVARFTQGSNGRLCSVEVVHTDLPDDLARCLRDKALLHPRLPDESGRLEMVVTFHSPWSRRKLGDRRPRP